LPLRFTCPCGQKIKTVDGTAGKKARCPGCQRRLVIPQSDDYTTTAVEAQDTEAIVVPHGPADAVSSPTPVESAVPRTLSRPPSSSKGLVLVVDGDPVDRDKTVDILRVHGYAVLEATDGVHGLDMIRTHHPDAAIVDVRLSGISGFQLLQQLRNLSNTANKEDWSMPVLVTANRLSGRDKQYAISIGAESFLVKPLSPAQLCPRLEKCVEKYRTH